MNYYRNTCNKLLLILRFQIGHNTLRMRRPSTSFTVFCVALLSPECRENGLEKGIALIVE